MFWNIYFAGHKYFYSNKFFFFFYMAGQITVQEIRSKMGSFGLGNKQITVILEVLTRKSVNSDKLICIFVDKKHGIASIENLKYRGLLKGLYQISPTNKLLFLMGLDANAYKRTDTEVSK